MKRTILIASILFIGSGTFLISAQEANNVIPPNVPPLDPNAVDGGPAKPCPFCMMMGQSMLQSQVVPLSDGGVLLMMGHTLFKYDANLNLVNQVQIQIDPVQLQSQIQQLMQSCPMCAQRLQMRQEWIDGRPYEQLNGQTNGQTNGVSEQKNKSKPAKPQTKTEKKQF